MEVVAWADSLDSKYDKFIYDNFIVIGMFKLTPVTGKGLVGRNDVVGTMLRTLSDKKSNVGYALYGARRIGKTSVLRELERKLSQGEDIIPVYLSFWELVPNSAESLINRLSIALLEGYRKRLSIRYRIKDILGTSMGFISKFVRELKIGVKLREDIEFLLSISLQKRFDLDDAIRRVFDLPEELARETSTKCVLLIDEFPSILDMEHGPQIVKLLRTMHEEQKVVAICISGSIRKSMEAVALSPTSAFYKQLIPIEIKPLKYDDVGLILRSNLRDYGIGIGEEAVKRVYDYTAGMPYYVQFLGLAIVSRKVGRAKLTVKEIDDITNKFLLGEGNLYFSEIFESLVDREKTILVEMAKHDLHSASEVSKGIGEAPNIISKYLSYLIAKGILKKEGRGVYSITDVMLERWLKVSF